MVPNHSVQYDKQLPHAGNKGHFGRTGQVDQGQVKYLISVFASAYSIVFSASLAGDRLLWTTSSCCWIATAKPAAAFASGSGVWLANAEVVRLKKITARNIRCYRLETSLFWPNRPAWRQRELFRCRSRSRFGRGSRRRFACRSIAMPPGGSLVWSRARSRRREDLKSSLFLGNHCGP